MYLETNGDTGVYHDPVTPDILNLPKCLYSKRLSLNELKSWLTKYL